MSGKGWFSSAISGLESRLDTILAEDDQASAKARAAESTSKQESSGKAVVGRNVPAEPASRNTSRTRPNSRLQDRLAKAVNKATERADSRPSSDLGSRPDSPALQSPADTAKAITEPKPLDHGPPSADRGNGDSKSLHAYVEPVSAPASKPVSDSVALSPHPVGTSPKESSPNNVSAAANSEPLSTTIPTTGLQAIQAPTSTPPTQSLDLLPSRTSADIPVDTQHVQVVSGGAPKAEADLHLLQTTYENASRENREEINAHLERIDALQAKLTYLSQRLVDYSKEEALNSEATPDSRKLAEKDIQIAALMEEGQKLSKNEMKQLNLIKKLRSKIQELEKENTGWKERLATAEKGLSEQAEKVRLLEAAEKSSQEKIRFLGKLEKDLAAMRFERDEAGRTINELRKQLLQMQSHGNEAEKKIHHETLEAQKLTIVSLREDIESMTIERKLAEERAKRELQASRDEARTQQERAKVIELELRGEISNLESKLELLRSRTEEATSSAKGDSQATLLRQVETLQTQYSLASQNWQGIETSLTSRVSALEKERDEVAKRESELRRKTRETNSKVRRLEEDLENVTERARFLETELSEHRTENERMQERLEQAQMVAQGARSESEMARKTWEMEFQQRLKDEKARWKADLQPQILSSDFNCSRTDSLSNTQRRHSPDPLGLTNRRLPRSISGTSDVALSPMDRMFDESARRPSSSRQKPITRVRSPDTGTPQRQDSISSNMVNFNGGGVSETPSIFTVDHDDPFDNISSPHRTLNDMISVSTVGAGPSVQLVERMSAAVRRLESEKAISKEEMARLSAQRDEAREEVVLLMREVEQKRAQDQKVEELQKQLNEMDERYQTTLEMLGEKTERVEELESDVDDLKKMYRELVQTMK